MLLTEWYYRPCFVDGFSSIDNLMMPLRCITTHTTRFHKRVGFECFKNVWWYWCCHAPQVGLEPTRLTLTGCRSTTELLRIWWTRRESNPLTSVEERFYRPPNIHNPYWNSLDANIGLLNRQVLMNLLGASTTCYTVIVAYRSELTTSITNSNGLLFSTTILKVEGDKPETMVTPSWLCSTGTCLFRASTFQKTRFGRL